MSTGISISSINRIKELAEEKKYVEALEVLDTQNLDKSINPQFLRICGEIFRENKRYYDARKYLLKAHQMSPQGLRIIAELMQLYLEMGYFKVAEKYYEEYQFYTSLDDAQRDYVEYMFKKGTGVDVKELASILIPILDRMPEDRWNFEAVLLYDKMDHKDKALDECRYILENFKESSYVKPVIDYIDDKLDVDAYFNVFAMKEKKDNKEEFADLRELEDKILEQDFLRMYPPEAKIIIEAEDKDLTDVIASAKDKRTRAKKTLDDVGDGTDKSDANGATSEKPKRKRKSSKKKQAADEEAAFNEDGSIEQNGSLEQKEPLTPEELEEAVRKEREEQLEKILAKKTDVEDVKESAKKAVESLKNPEPKKPKRQRQVKAVTEDVKTNVKKNVKKAKDVIEDAVGVKTEADNIKKKASTDIVDGIIEGVIETPRKPVGQVVTDEELDSLIPDSLESLSAEEISDIEKKKAEEEKIELEALENQLRMEEEKKAKKEEKRKNRKNSKNKDKEQSESDVDTTENADGNASDADGAISNAAYEQLKEQFLAANGEEEEEEQPLESLGFISVVQSDVDDKLEEDMPFAAEILHQMIDNKEFYTGEDSTKFEAKASYDNHGFEVEDYEFTSSHDGYILQTTHEDLYNLAQDEDIPTVEIIYAKEDVMDFDDMVPQDNGFKEDYSSHVEEQQNVQSLHSDDAVKYDDSTVEDEVFNDAIENEPDPVESDHSMQDKISEADSLENKEVTEDVSSDMSESNSTEVTGEIDEAIQSNDSTETETFNMTESEEVIREETFAMDEVSGSDKDEAPLEEVVNEQQVEDNLSFKMPETDEQEHNEFADQAVSGEDKKLDTQPVDKERQLHDAIEDVEKGNIIETYSESSFDEVTDEQILNSYDENAYQNEIVEEKGSFGKENEKTEEKEEILLQEDNTWKEEVLEPEVSWNDSITNDEDEVVKEKKEQSAVFDDRNDLRIRIIITSNMSQLLKELKEGR